MWGNVDPLQSLIRGLIGSYSHVELMLYINHLNTFLYFIFINLRGTSLLTVCNLCDVLVIGI